MSLNIQCSVCDNFINTAHNYSIVFTVLSRGKKPSDKVYLPQFCSQYCIQKWLEIREVEGWRDWCKQEKIEVLIKPQTNLQEGKFNGN